MKSSLFFIFVILNVFAGYSQMTQPGTVTLLSSGRKGISGVQIMMNGAAPETSDQNGRFALSFPAKKTGDVVSVSRLYKSGYEVVNHTKFLQWILSSAREMDVVLAPVGEIQRMRELYYHIGTEHNRKLFVARQKELNELYQQKKLTADERRNQMKQIQQELEDAARRLDYYSDIFAVLNKDELSELERQAFQLLEKGEVENAIILYQGMHLVDKLDKQLELQQQVRDNLTEEVPALYRYVDLCMFDGKKEYTEKALAICRRLAQSDETNFQYVQKYALTLADLRFTDESLKWNERALAIAPSEYDTWVQLNVVSRLYLEQGLSDIAYRYIMKEVELVTAEDCEIALEIRIPAINRSMMDLASWYELMNSPKDALEIYLDLLEDLKEELAEENQQEAEKELAKMYDCIQRAYSNIHQEQQAQKYRTLYLGLMEKCTDQTVAQKFYVEINKITPLLTEGKIDEALLQADTVLVLAEQLNAMNPQQYLVPYRSTWSIKAALLQEKGKYDEAERILLENILCWKPLKEIDSIKYMSYMVADCHVLAGVYQSNKEINKGIAVLTDVLTYAEKLQKIDFAYTPKLLDIYTALGALNQDANELDDALYYDQLAIGLYEILMKMGKENYEQKYSAVLNNLGGVYLLKEDWGNARKVLQKSLGIKKKYWEKNPKVYFGEYASSLINMGDLEFGVKHYARAEDYYQEALKLLSSGVQKNPAFTGLYRLVAWLGISQAVYKQDRPDEAGVALEEARKVVDNMLDAYPDIYRPYLCTLCLYEAILLQRTGRQQEGRQLEEKALKDMQAYAGNGFIVQALDFYKKQKIYPLN